MIINETCSLKNKYKSLQEAFNKGKLEMEIREGTRQLYIYKCQTCHNFHLTYNSKKLDVRKYKIL